MNLKQIKIGETYHHPLLGKVIAHSITDQPTSLPGPKNRVLCRKPLGATEYTVMARQLKSLKEEENERRMEELNREEGERLLSELNALLGDGVDSVNHYVSTEFAILGFSEEAVDNLLSICGANPLPESRRPSGTADRKEWIRRATLLGRRVRRVLGVGRSGNHTGHALAREDMWASAQITLFSGELEKAVAKVREAKHGPQSNALSDLL